MGEVLRRHEPWAWGGGGAKEASRVASRAWVGPLCVLGEERPWVSLAFLWPLTLKAPSISDFGARSLMNFRGLSQLPSPLSTHIPQLWEGVLSKDHRAGPEALGKARTGHRHQRSEHVLEHSPQLFTPAAPVRSPHRPATKVRPGRELLSLWGTVRPCCLLPEWPECTEPSKSSWLPFFSSLFPYPFW